MMFVIGIVLFVFVILILVVLYECGYMWVVCCIGMKVCCYFVGFGFMLWLIWCGEIEYGVKVVLLGGFCDIVGMILVEEFDFDECDCVMYKQVIWKWVVVLFVGFGMNFVICLVLIYVIVLVWGLFNLYLLIRVVIGEIGCVVQEVSQGKFEQCIGFGLVVLVGICFGDVVVKVGDILVFSFDEMVVVVCKLYGSVLIVVECDGIVIVIYVDIEFI